MTDKEIDNVVYDLDSLRTQSGAFLRRIGESPYEHSRGSVIGLKDGAIAATIFGHEVTTTSRPVRKTGSTKVNATEYVFFITHKDAAAPKDAEGKLILLTLTLEYDDHLYDRSLDAVASNDSAIPIKNTYVGQRILQMLADKIFDSKVFEATH